MSSTAVTGKNGKVIIGAEVAEIRNWKIARPQDTHDTSSMSSGGNREKKHGMKDWNGTFETIKYVDLSGTSVVASFYVGASATASTPIYSGTILISDAPVNVPYDDVVNYEHAFEGSGPCTPATS
jgi:predicted secreted protein